MYYVIEDLYSASSRVYLGRFWSNIKLKRHLIPHWSGIWFHHIRSSICYIIGFSLKPVFMNYRIYFVKLLGERTYYFVCSIYVFVNYSYFTKQERRELFDFKDTKNSVTQQQLQKLKSGMRKKRTRLSTNTSLFFALYDSRVFTKYSLKQNVSKQIIDVDVRTPGSSHREDSMIASLPIIEHTMIQ